METKKLKENENFLELPRLGNWDKRNKFLQRYSSPEYAFGLNDLKVW